MAWTDVLTNAYDQENHARHTATRQGVTMEDFYTELHTPPISGAFPNTLGSHLIPDLLTSPCVVADIHDWPDPSGLIATYGVDLKFLLTLRDKGHVVLCANQLPERYENRPWLHDVLADKRTIFRSVRTPMFFHSHFQSWQRRETSSRRRYCVR